MTEIKYITPNDKEFLHIINIRKTVFIEEQGADKAQEFDCYDRGDGKSLYALLYMDKEPVATARLIADDKGFKLSRVAILKQYRGKGLGKTIAGTLIKKAFDQGADTVFVDAQKHAVPFYEKMGFVVIGSEITDRGLPHIPMRISRSKL